jgi:hypothetical protein
MCFAGLTCVIAKTGLVGICADLGLVQRHDRAGGMKEVAARHRRVESDPPVAFATALML